MLVKGSARLLTKQREEKVFTSRKLLVRKVANMKNTVESPEWPGRQICKDCATVLPDSFGKTNIGVFLDDQSHIIKAAPVEKLMQRQFRDFRKSPSCMDPNCPSYDSAKGRGVPLTEKYIMKDGEKHKIWECDICKGTEKVFEIEEPSYAGRAALPPPLFAPGEAPPPPPPPSPPLGDDSNKTQLLTHLQKLDPQYDINLQKYKNLTNEDLKGEIIALEKAGIAVKKYFPKLEKVERKPDMTHQESNSL